MMGLADFFLPVNLPFFVAGAVDGSGIAVNALSDVDAGAAGAAAVFLFFFVLAAAGGTASMGGRAGATMMTLISLPAGNSKTRGAAEAAAIVELGWALPWF